MRQGLEGPGCSVDRVCIRPAGLVIGLCSRVCDLMKAIEEVELSGVDQ